MKRFGQIFPQIATWDNLTVAFYQAALGKRQSAEVQRFAAGLSTELARLVAELRSGQWRPGSYRRFVVRDPKLRVIHAAPFRDRVVHHAVMRWAGPCLERAAIDRSYACRLGKGNRAALRHAAHCTRSYPFFVKLDVRRYFDSIDHGILLNVLHRRFKDGALLHLLLRVIGSYQVTPGRGLPIGTLTSQYFANAYLDAFDHWVTESAQCREYARYMDEFVLWDDDPSKLRAALGPVAEWLRRERGLQLKGEPVVRDCRDGLPFLGYRLTPAGIALARPARRRFVARMRDYEHAYLAGRLSARDLQRRTDSLLAFVSVAQCQNWRRRILKTLPLFAGEGRP